MANVCGRCKCPMSSHDDHASCPQCRIAAGECNLDVHDPCTICRGWTSKQWGKLRAPLPYAAYTAPLLSMAPLPYAAMPAMSARPPFPMGYYGQGNQFPLMPNPNWMMSEREQMLQQQLLQERQQFEAWRASQAQPQPQPPISF